MKISPCDYVRCTYQAIQLCFNKSCYIEPFSYFPGGGWGEIKSKDHLNPAETETGSEIGNILCRNVEKDIKLP